MTAKTKTTAKAKRPRAAPPSVEITEAIVLGGLLKEATGEGVPGTTPASRIAAWKALGEYLGLFSGKPESAGRAPLDELVLEAARAKAEKEAGKP